MGRQQAARELRAAVMAYARAQPDEAAVQFPSLFPAWEAGHYAVGDRAAHGGNLYRCVQEHDAQADWPPDAAASLWARCDNPADPWPAWRQPAGAHDAYAQGTQVSHNGKHYVSDADGNVWEPPEQWTEA